jgi:hypothetical protein
LTPTATGPTTPPVSHWRRRLSSIDAPMAPATIQTAAYSPQVPSAFMTVSTGS